MQIILILLAALGFISSLSTADLPSEIPKCKAAETDCVKNSIMQVLKKYPKGNPAFGLVPIDKLLLENIFLSQPNSDRPIQLDFKLNSAEVYGIEKATVTRVVGFEDDLDKSKFEVYGMVPMVTIKGDYDTHGRILLLPLSGKGDSEIKLQNVKLGIKVKLGSEIQNGKRYAVLKKLKIQLEPERLLIRLDNLFNGNKELGETMNQVINENWKDIWNELGTGIHQTVEKMFSDLLIGVLKKLSYDDFYKKD